MVDFATSSTTWFNDKSEKRDTPTEIVILGARNLLRELQGCIDTMGLANCYERLVKREVATPIAWKNRDVEVMLSSAEDVVLS